jgi:hypothetical protein
MYVGRVNTRRAWLWSNVGLTIAAVLCAVILAPPAGAPPVQALSWLLFTGSSVHVASTGWLFTLPAVRAYAREHPVRCGWVPLGLVAVAAAAAALISPLGFQWLLVPFLGWQLWHYQKQNVGLAALAASAQRVGALLQAERRALLLAGLAGIAALLARPGLLGLHVQAPGGPPFVRAVLVLAGAAFVVAVAGGVTAIARRPRQHRPAGFWVTYLASLLFWLPAFAFASPYAAVGGMTIAHGAQYLLLVTLVAGGPGSAGQSRSKPARYVRHFRLALLANIAFLGGAALSAASHLHDAGPLGRCLFGAYLGIVMSHFIIDAGLWRLRDPLARRFLVAYLHDLLPTGPTAERQGAASRVMRLPIDRQPI